ncbi:unnamed protein product [Owenia fusiformis]|uniref:Uncharacterized protein n=1 Tax=Owenia fusiformis TaxID=6347 RepID=A0A8J1TYM1_OWEFU|nr:unnamed protein product [Owenia fusiformis]
MKQLTSVMTLLLQSTLTLFLVLCSTEIRVDAFTVSSDKELKDILKDVIQNVLLESSPTFQLDNRNTGLTLKGLLLTVPEVEQRGERQHHKSIAEFPIYKRAGMRGDIPASKFDALIRKLLGLSGKSDDDIGRAIQIRFGRK